MKIRIKQQQSCDTLIVLAAKEEAKKYADFEGEKDTSAVYYAGPKKRKIVVGLGKAKDVTVESIRRAVNTGLSRARGIKVSQASVLLPQIKSLEASDAAAAVVEGAVLGNYVFDKYKTSGTNKTRTASVEIITKKRLKPVVERTQVVCEAVNYARGLINENAHIMTPQKLAEEAKALTAGKKCSVTVLDEKAIAEKKLGLLTAVGQGGSHPPRLVIIEYKGNPQSDERVAVVGKGVTFDSGGMNLKPSGHIETMRSDMSGAAAVLGIVKAAMDLNLKVNLFGVLAAAENMLDAKSYYPGDIYTSYSGKTVHIANTDAEGRLILADAISYVIKNYKPSAVIDIATLTGAIVVCFSTVLAGLFSNDRRMARQLFDSGERTSERLWELPIYQEYRDAMKAETADLSNLSNFTRGEAGSITGAAFLEAFVEKTPWAHIDIAGTAFNDKKQSGYTPKYATGFGVRLIIDWLQNRK